MFIENGFTRDKDRSRHSNDVKEYTIAKALRHKIVSSADWSRNLGGPSSSTIPNGCIAKVKDNPFLDKGNLLEHMEEFKSILHKFQGITDYRTNILI